MGLTATHPDTLRPLNIISRTTAQRKETLTRLSLGFRVNRAADDPAGLIASSILDSERAGVNAAISNNQRADSLLEVADGALTEEKLGLPPVYVPVAMRVGSAPSRGR